MPFATNAVLSSFHHCLGPYELILKRLFATAYVASEKVDNHTPSTHHFVSSRPLSQAYVHGD